MRSRLSFTSTPTLPLYQIKLSVTRIRDGETKVRGSKRRLHRGVEKFKLPPTLRMSSPRHRRLAVRYHLGTFSFNYAFWNGIGMDNVHLYGTSGISGFYAKVN